MLDIVIDALVDSVKLLPFLYLTYLLMEFIEHKMNQKARRAVRNAGKYGPAAGAVLGAFPQCGFSAAAANLYAGRIITLGTLVAIFLSTSDEMLPVLVLNQTDWKLILSVLGMKILIGMTAGFVIDWIFRKRKGAPAAERIGHICEHEHCHCEKNIWLSAIKHTAVIIVFIFLVTLGLNLLIYYIGEEVIARLVGQKPVFAPVVSGMIGLIPNCASSVVLTQLYANGVMSLGTLMAGLLAGSGVGMLVLFRIHDRLKENLKILAMVYGIGVITGIMIDAAGGLWL